MTYLWTIVPVLQIIFAIHAYKNGNIVWIFIILFFPGIGVIIYLFVEFIPSLKHDSSLKEVSHTVTRKLLPNREIQRLKDELDLNNSINNRLALANCYLENNQAENAVPIFEKCIEGVYKDDPNLLFTLSKAYYSNRQYQSALDKLLMINKNNPNFINKGVPFLIAKCYDQLGFTEKAIEEYKKIVNISTGEEVRCGYALALKKHNDLSEAKKQFETIIKNAKISPGFYRASEKKWIKIALQEIKNIG